MKNDYMNLIQHISVPEELNERVLKAARDAREKDQNKKLTGENKQRRYTSLGIKALVSCACVFTFVFGSVLFIGGRSRSELGVASESPNSVDSASQQSVFPFSFSIVAYAAGGEQMIEANSSRIVFESGNGSADAQQGCFTGCLFRVTGDGIENVSAVIDKGGLYRMETLTVDRSTEAGLNEFRAINNLEDERTLGAATVMSHSNDEIIFDCDVCWPLGSSFSESYSAGSSYGFWTTPEQISGEADGDVRQSFHDCIDAFDGANLTVTVTFTDGSQQAKNLSLHSGKLAVCYPDGASGLQLTGEPAEGDEMYVYGIYADIS